MKINNEFKEQIRVRMPVVKMTHKAVCLEWDGRLCVVNFYGKLKDLLPPNVNIELVKEAIVNAHTGELEKLIY